VIAIIAILAALLLPALSRAKMQAWRTGSVNNIKQLQMGARMYADDNNGVLLPNAPFNPPSPGAKAWIDVSTTAYEEGLGNQMGNTNTTILYYRPAGAVPGQSARRLPISRRYNAISKWSAG